ncbi:MAG: enoyl-CoA hydratase/isomerase family protein [Desulfurellaceae bacterium]|nr:enoyl-CoA hydratase/isomerase family protein [Desulfurellaceae bacterium]
MPQPLVRYAAQHGIALIEFDNPPANTYSYEMMTELDQAILRARFDDEIYVLLLRGVGDKFFSAGADIEMLNQVSPQFKYNFCLHANETLNRLERTPKLVIAALNGHAVGGGLEIAMACDLRLARRDAGQVGLPEIALGVLPGTGGSQRLTRHIGKARALELMATGRRISFEEAQDLGLVHDIFDAQDYFEQVLAYARQFTPPNKASKAVGRIKLAVQAGAEMPLFEALSLEQELQAGLFSSADGQEGLRSYVTKSMPQFKGV